jgi:lysophospholipase L1-like esterase
MDSRLRSVLVGLAVMIVAVVVTLGFVEVGIRLFWPRKHFAATVNTWDGVVGTRHIPGARGFVKCEAYEMDLIINSRGLRDREFPYEKPAGTRRILCLGGSFTAGYGVQAERTFPKVLEYLLNSDSDESVTWEVLNAGVGSTGTAHQLAFFNTEGFKYSPDIVLLCFSQQTDHWDNARSGLYSIEDGRLVKHDAPKTRARIIQRIATYIPLYNTFFARSHLLNLIKSRVARHHYRDLARRIAVPGDAAEVGDAEDDLTRRLLVSLRDAAVACGGRMMMIAIPLPDSWDYFDETVELVRYMQSNGVAFVDASPALRSGCERGVRVHYPGDLHWTEAGHRLVAESIYQYLAGAADSTFVPSDRE